jgi:hypothetical protein
VWADGRFLTYIASAILSTSCEYSFEYHFKRLNENIPALFGAFFITDHY